MERIAAGKPIHTLILTGHDGPFHDWAQATSKALEGSP